MVWSAEPGIDLSTDESTLLRAGAEANLVAIYAGSDRSYPGFARALTPENPAYEPSGSSAFGTYYEHIAELQPTDSGFAALYCHQGSLAAEKKGDRYRTTISGAGTSWVMFERAKSLPTQPTSMPEQSRNGDSGADWKAPVSDQFTGWTVNFKVQANVDFGDAKQRCNRWSRTVVPDAPEQGSRYVVSDEPPKALPASPGW